MISSKADRLHASAALCRARSVEFVNAFEVHLRSAAPALASAFFGASTPFGSHPAVILLAAVVSPEGSAQATIEFDALRQAVRGVLGADAFVGRALMAGLRETLGPDFDEATHDAWAKGYIHLVERAMAVRRNRLDLVA